MEDHDSGTSGISDDLWVSDAGLIRDIHTAIVEEYPGTAAGVRKPDAIGSAVVYVSEGYFRERPATIREAAAHLLRLLVADHSFVDGNKRTALNAVAVFYAMNGHYFDYGDRIRTVLKRFGRGEDVAIDAVVDRLRTIVTPEDEIDDPDTLAQMNRLRRWAK
jgi:death-on-curing protein